MILDTTSEVWLRKRALVMNQLAVWGYPVDLMRTTGLSAAGYYEFVLDADGKRQIDRSSNRLMDRAELWDDPAHWEWMLENAPLILEPEEEYLDQIQ